MQKHKNTNGMREQRSKSKHMIKIDSNPNIVHLSHEKGVDHVKHSKANEFPFFYFSMLINLSEST